MSLFAVYFGVSAADFGNQDSEPEIPASTLALRVFISSLVIPVTNMLVRFSTERFARIVFVEGSHFNHRSAYYVFQYGTLSFVTIFGIPGELAQFLFL
jgi:hypothetical protein